jgi:hypothetical protein
VIAMNALVERLARPGLRLHPCICRSVPATSSRRRRPSPHSGLPARWAVRTCRPYGAV